MSFVPTASEAMPWFQRLIGAIGGQGGDTPGQPDPIVALQAQLSGGAGLPKQAGLFGSGYARFLAAQDAARQAADLLASGPRAPNFRPPAPTDADDWRLSAASSPLPADSAPAFNDIVHRASDPQAKLNLAAGPSQARRVAAPPAAGAFAQPVDPNRTEVFQPGPDGKLRPIPGWPTTGPFDFGKWAHNIDWPGVGWDLATDALGFAGAGVDAPLTAWKAAQLAARLATPSVGIERSVHEKTKHERRR